jgi:hypothetical protein
VWFYPADGLYHEPHRTTLGFGGNARRDAVGDAGGEGRWWWGTHFVVREHHVAPRGQAVGVALVLAALHQKPGGEECEGERRAVSSVALQEIARVLPRFQRRSVSERPQSTLVPS